MRTAVLVAVLAVAVAALVVNWFLFRRPLPRIAGSVDVDGIDAPVRILRDRLGVPHVYAASAVDAAFAVGFVHAQDRGWQLELHRRVACGRIAELAGAEALEADRHMRRLGLLRVALEEEAMLEGEERAVLEAYAAGVNAVLCSGAQARPLELQLVRVRPEPWRPAHSLAAARLLALGLACDADFELQRVRLLAALGPDVAAALELPYPQGNPLILAGTAGTVPAGAARRLQTAYRKAARWLPTGDRAAASNAWVVGGAVTSTGRPMLCNDPHLPPSVPSIWYQIHLSVEGDFDSAGVGFPGMPLPLIGHNRRVAWGFTNSFADVQDHVVEEFTDAEGTRYRTEGGPVDTAVAEERIAVRRGAEVVERVLTTRHGPVVERFEGTDGRHRGLALQWTALQPRPGLVAAGLALQRCGDFASFRAAVVRQNLAPQNCVYADVDGHIAYLLGGPVPVRPGAPSPLPLAGWEADRRFVRTLTDEELPQVEDPEGHVIVTANNRVVGEGFPFHIGFDTMNGYRARRIAQLLEDRTGLDAARMNAVQMDVVCPPAVAVTRLLQTAVCTSPAAERARLALCAWDGTMAVDGTEPSIYAAFCVELAREVLEPRCGEAWRLVAGEMSHPVFGFSGNITGRLTPWLLQHWRAADTAVTGGRGWDEVAAAALTAATTRLRAAHGRPSRWRWGRLHRLPLEHALAGSRVAALLFNLRGVEVGGDTDTVLQTAAVPGGDLTARGWAPSWRMVVDVGAWDDSTAVLYPGQSGQRGSRHYDDQVDDWRRNRQHRIAFSEERVRAGVEASLLLRPRRHARHAEDEGEDEERRAA